MLGHASVRSLICLAHLLQRECGGRQDPVVTLRERLRHTREHKVGQEAKIHFIDSESTKSHKFKSSFTGSIGESENRRCKLGKERETQSFRYVKGQKVLFCFFELCMNGRGTKSERNRTR